MKTIKAFMILVVVVTTVYMMNNYIKGNHNIKIVETNNPEVETKEPLDKLPEEEKPLPEQPKEENKIEEKEPVKNEEPITNNNDIKEEPVKETPVKETPQEPNAPTGESSVGISNKKYSWWFTRNKEHKKPTAQREIDITKYDAYYVDTNTDEKVIYLTFDCGYENGYTPAILDTLKANDAKAIFFVTKSFIKNNKALVQRMKEEGHLLGNHSVTHPSFPTLSDADVKKEIEETARYYKEVTGYDMDMYFRPPMGEYSERTLQITKDLGYKTIFWSIAYADYDVNKQPGKEYVYNHFVANHHPGAIPLIHNVSQSNTEALDDVLKFLKEQGYRFGSVEELK